jgi:3-dehydroquinate synthase
MAPVTAGKQDMEFTWGRPAATTAVRFCRGASGVMERLRDARLFAVVDSAVAGLWDIGPESLGTGEENVFLLDAREELKSPETLASIWASMDHACSDRDTVLAGIGGGLTLDVAAMAASTWHRGTGLVLVPTTVLAMADACLGGKTAVNVGGAKNQAGTFYPAGEILLAGDFVNTLPPREYRNGMAEILKAGLIGDRAVGGLLASPPERDGDHGWLMDLVGRSLGVKGSIVSEDLEESGPRRLLNLGHTLGHALESASGFDLSHGEAVGLGMIAAARMAGNTALAGKIGELLETSGLPVKLGDGFDGDGLESFLDRDKKTSGGSRTWVLPFDWEDCRLVRLDASEEQRLLREAMGFLLSG